MIDSLKKSNLEKRIGENIFHIDDNLYRIPLPTGYRIGDANVFFQDGDQPVLFDSGTGNDDSMLVLAEALKVIGRSVTEIQHLMLTHAHIDHSGGAGKVCAESGCRVYVHEREVDRVKDFLAVSRKEMLFLLLEMQKNKMLRKRYLLLSL